MNNEVLCQENVITTTPATNIKDAIKLLDKNNIGALIVVNENSSLDTPIGIVTDRDIALSLAKSSVDIEQTCVSDIMSENLLTLTVKDGIKQWIKQMCEKGVRRAAVIDEKEKLIGVTSLDDLIVLLAEELHDLSKIISKQIIH